ncbi:MAG: RNAase P [Candidatus Thermoplasmatota archaeon]|nr:RNAase P [Candidatus Thermoplasmatota archaeon]
MRSYRVQRKKIARERIARLLDLAEQRALQGDLDLATRYVELARKLSMKYLVRIPRHFKRRFCKHCYTYLQPGNNCTVRLTRRHLAIHCHACGAITRIPYGGQP